MGVGHTLKKLVPKVLAPGNTSSPRPLNSGRVPSDHVRQRALSVPLRRTMTGDRRWHWREKKGAEPPPSRHSQHDMAALNNNLNSLVALDPRNQVLSNLRHNQAVMMHEQQRHVTTSAMDQKSSPYLLPSKPSLRRVPSEKPYQVRYEAESKIASSPRRFGGSKKMISEALPKKSSPDSIGKFEVGCRRPPTNQGGHFLTSSDRDASDSTDGQFPQQQTNTKPQPLRTSYPDTVFSRSRQVEKSEEEFPVMKATLFQMEPYRRRRESVPVHSGCHRHPESPGSPSSHSTGRQRKGDPSAHRFLQRTPGRQQRRCGGEDVNQGHSSESCHLAPGVKEDVVAALNQSLLMTETSKKKTISAGTQTCQAFSSMAIERRLQRLKKSLHTIADELEVCRQERDLACRAVKKLQEKICEIQHLQHSDTGNDVPQITSSVPRESLRKTAQTSGRQKEQMNLQQEKQSNLEVKAMQQYMTNHWKPRYEESHRRDETITETQEGTATQGQEEEDPLRQFSSSIQERLAHLRHEALQLHREASEYEKERGVLRKELYGAKLRTIKQDCHLQTLRSRIHELQQTLEWYRDRGGRTSPLETGTEKEC